MRQATAASEAADGGDDKRRWEKLTTLVGEFRVLQAKTYEKLEQIEAVLAESPGSAIHVKRLMQRFDQLWTSQYGPPRYVFTHGKDQASLKRLLKTLPVEEIEARMVAYFRSLDDYAARARHPLALFVAGVNRYGSQQPTRTLLDDAPAVADCKHDPPCTSDQEHTRRKMRELRA